MKKINLFKVAKVLFVVCMILSLLTGLYMYFYSIPQVIPVNGFFETAKQGVDFRFYIYQGNNDRGFDKGERLSLNYNSKNVKTISVSGIVTQITNFDYHLTAGKIVQYTIHLSALPKGLRFQRYYQINLIQLKKIRLINILFQ